MKKRFFGISILLVSLFSSIGIIAAHATETLPDGSYNFAALDALGNEIGKTVKVDVPFNDPNFAVFALCSRKGAIEIAAKDDSGKIIMKTKCESK